ncbi:SET and MYND domain-containing protein 4-like [Bradysia coprophila]|uniref:SET and MYND domain-containing protein 4-like n=1 Tax=Bradysia coprophila TaxID=38358 RepID=UPI00187D92B5|nr:SET and MYND domain-containing protein 4-like [Bradysia coprophila]
MDEENFRNPLWLKEDAADHPYVDIFANKFYDIFIDDVKSEIDSLFNDCPSKNNAKSKLYRVDGNKLFADRKYHLALEKYNRSACYAENGSDELVLAFSNRSICYLKLKLFRECLNDIEMIKRSDYPSRLQAKLDSRQAECVQFLSNNSVDSVRIDVQNVELSYGEHFWYEGVAQCLELQYNSEWGRHVIADRDLEINETVMVESPFSFVGHDCSDSKYYRCSHCYRSLMNFIPCTGCVSSMFCNSECLEEASKSRHQFECQLTKIESTDCECKEKEFQLVLDLLWKIISAFETVYDLIRTIDLIVQWKDVEATRTNETLKKLEMILQLETNEDKQNATDWEHLIRNSIKMYLVAMEMPQFEERFVSERQKRFLKHLILHLLLTAKQSTLFSDLDVDVTIFRFAELRDYGIGLYPIGSLLNHSCVPNVYCYSVDNRLICKVIRPIKSGDQLFRSYLSGHIIIMDDPDDSSLQSSYEFLKTEYKIENCKCSYCLMREISPETLPDPWLKTKDPIYLKIRSILTGEIKTFFQMSDGERQSYVDAAATYLCKYEEMHPTREIVVVQIYLQNYWMITTRQCDRRAGVTDDTEV